MSNEGKNERGDTPGGQKPEKVEDRPSVGTVNPEDYPEPANAVDVAGSGRGDGPGQSGENYQPGGSSTGADRTDD